MIVVRASMLAASLCFGPAALAQPGPAVPHIRLLAQPVDGLSTEIRAAVPLTGYEQWPTAADYPAEALAERRTSTEVIELTISREGEVTGCRSILYGKQGRAFTAAACAIAWRGDYTHAIDRAGTPQMGSLMLWVSFDLDYPGHPPARAAGLIRPTEWVPPHPPAPRDPGALVLHGADPAIFPNRAPVASLTITARGKAVICRIVESSGTDAGDAAVCRHLTGLPFTPARDEKGRAWHSRDTPFHLTVQP